MMIFLMMMHLSLPITVKSSETLIPIMMETKKSTGFMLRFSLMKLASSVYMLVNAFSDNQKNLRALDYFEGSFFQKNQVFLCFEIDFIGADKK